MFNIGKTLGSFAVFCYRHAYLSLVLTLVAAMAALHFGRQITIDADLAALLPDSFASVQDLDAVKSRFGGFGYVVVTASGAEPDALRRFADDVAPRIRELEQVNFVDQKRSNDFFGPRALYYLDLEDLQTVRDRIDERWRWEKQKHNPLLLDLDESETTPPALDFKDIEDKYRARGVSHWLDAQRSSESYYFDRDQRMLAIFVKPKLKSTDLAYSRQMIADIERAVNSVDLRQYGANFKVQLTGRYKKQIDMQAQLEHDTDYTNSLALILIIAYLLLHFLRIEALVLIVVPMVLGGLFTFGFAAVVFGQLNILTAFIGVMLLGLSIDHGVHLLTRYREERKHHLSNEQVIYHTFSSTGKAVTTAAFSTLAGFVALAFSEFRAFHEYGVIAAAGMVFIIFGYVWVMPPLFRLIEKLPWQLSEKRWGAATAGKFAAVYQRYSIGIVVIGAILVLVTLMHARDVSFNYDFESLGNQELPSYRLDKEVNALLGYSQTPIVLMAKNAQEAKLVVAKLREQKNNNAGSTIDFVLGMSDLVPEQQLEKREVLEQIEKITRRIKSDWLQGTELERFNELRERVAAQPFGTQDLPPQLAKLFGNSVNNKADERTAIMLFAAVSLSDGKRVMQLADELRAVTNSGGSRLIIAGESMVLADILHLVFEETPQVLAGCLLMVTLVLWFFMRNVAHTLICLTTSILTIGLTFGVMAAFDLQLNYINILMVPVLLGLSVDSGVHLVSRAIEGVDLQDIIGDTGIAIIVSTVTSALGLGTLLLTNHAGLMSLAIIALIGFVVNTLVALAFIPSFLTNRRLFPARESATAPK